MNSIVFLHHRVVDIFGSLKLLKNPLFSLSTENLDRYKIQECTKRFKVKDSTDWEIWCDLWCSLMSFVPFEYCFNLCSFCFSIYILYTYLFAKLILNQNMHTSIKIHILVLSLQLLILSQSNIIFHICTKHSILTRNLSLLREIFILL